MPYDDDPTATSTGASDPALDATMAAPDGSAGAASGGSGGSGSGGLPPPTRIGRYEVRAVLGSGGMGVVYRARDPELDRDLAIKVVQPSASTPRAQERLLEEARAMAKLRHPAVVPVFDVGTTARGVYIVMPMVGGATMYDWMKEPRPWRQVLARFMTAGRGLAAAHAAGLVHRDFKPRNVLLGDGGEVMVADFGIAARTDDSLDPDRAVSTPGAAQVSSIAGTPAYMAPEQAEGGVIDARADQYSFCVSLWEALCGERPEQAETRTRAGASMRALANATGRRGAPAWLLAVIARGFSALPERRWPSMEALLGHIERRLRRPRLVAMIAGAVVLAGVAASAVLILPAQRTDPCPDPGRRLADVWSPAIRSQIEAAFTATGLPYAGDTLGRVVPVLDAYAGQWKVKQLAACRAGRVERTQSDALLDRRLSCLERRLAALQARTDAFRAADRGIVENAATQVDGLPHLDDCDDTEALLAYPTPLAAALRAQVKDLERQLDAVEALAVRGLVKELLAPLETIVATTRTLGYPPLHARALRLHGSAQYDNGQPTEATLRELVQTAAEAHDDAAVVHGWIHLIDDLASRQSKVAEAKALEPVAEAALVRAGSPPRLSYSLKGVLAARALAADEYELALTRAHEALDLAPTPMSKAAAQANVAATLATMGRYKDGLPFAEAALRETEAAKGPAHPDTASRLQLLAQLYGRTGATDQQEAMLGRALEIQRRASGEDSVQVGRTLLSLGNLARVRGKFEDAERSLARAVAIMEQAGDPQGLASAIAALADAIAGGRGFDAARPHYERALALQATATGRDHLMYAMVETNFANHWFEVGDCESARPYYVHSATYLEQVKHPGAVMALSMLAQCDLKDGRTADGIAALERAVATCRSHGCSAGALEGVLYVLGGQLIDTGRDRARGLALVREARAGFEQLGDGVQVKTIERWMKAHDLSPR